MMGFGFTSLILGAVARTMMNTEAIGWRATYLVLAVAIGAVLVIAAFLLKAPPAGTVFPAPKRAKKQTAAPARDYTPLEMIRRPSFWMLFAVVTLLAAAGSAAISSATDILSGEGGVGATAETATAVVGVLAIFNGLGRLASGAMFDNLGVRKTQFITSAVAVAAPVVVVFGIVAGSPVLGILGVCLCGFSYGTAPTTSAAFASAFFGTKNFSLNFSIVNLILIPASFAATLAGGLYKSSGSFVSTFIILAGVSAVGLVVNACMKKA
jgi:OFA family oxalate/formate antiporter-like MFS transporter